MKATKTAASSTALILWKYTCTCELKKKKIDQIPKCLYQSAHTHTVVSPVSDAIRYFGVLVMMGRERRREMAKEMMRAEGSALFLSSLPL